MGHFFRGRKMIKRRKFLKIGGVSAALFALGGNPLAAATKKKVAKKKAKKKVAKKVSRKMVSQLFLREVTGDELDPSMPGMGGIIGWAVPVINASKQLIVMVHLNDVGAGMDHEVIVMINGESFQEDVGMLRTNDMGNGTTVMMLNLMNYPRSVGTINVQVEVVNDLVYATATVPISHVPRVKRKKKKATKKKATRS